MPHMMYNLPMGLVSFNEQDNEEIFLLYTPEFEEGPQIQRDGVGEPWMVDPDDPIQDIVDPLEQRKGIWFVNQKARDDTRKKVQKDLKSLKNKLGRATNEDLREDIERRISYREQFLTVINNVKDYHREFERLYGAEFEIVGMQGCGNLTMNEWYVAYVDSAFSDSHSRGPVMLALPADKVAHPSREYTCLVKWKKPNDSGSRYSVEKLVFNFMRKRVLLSPEQDETGQMPPVQDITEQIEFAVYGTKVVSNGEITDFRTVVQQLADVRHAFRLPNVNPDDGGRPRKYFGRERWGDVWFGEAEMLSNLALRRAAISEPVILDCQFERMGIERAEVARHLERLGYRKEKERVPTERGTFRLREDRSDWIEVFLHRNVYSYTMLGVGLKGEIAFLAVAGLAGRVGQTLEAATHNILSYMTNVLRAEKVNALLIDQGDDVFQFVRSSSRESLKPTVPVMRGQLRAVFVVGRKK